ncbi:MAG: formimidoylglutamate deiminase [Phycisphaerales bacterium]
MATAEREIIEADLTWTGEAFEAGILVELDEDGAIESVGPRVEGGPAPTRRLSNRAILPGMVNAHSHAFQRGLRGRGERFPDGAGSFWSWREAMYDLVETMDESLIESLTRHAFREMLGAGITCVGEFHYLHHDARGRGFPFDEVVLRVASEVGVRLVLLNVYYRTGGIGQPLAGGQRRFRVDSPDQYWKQAEHLRPFIDPKTQSLGAVVHSIRAAPIGDIVELHREAMRRGLVFHMHLEEQRLEIEQCEEAYRTRPMALLIDKLEINDRFTAVHCTHTAKEDMERYLDLGGRVCVCPLTEANLGDGVPDLATVQARSGRVCLGTDSNARIDFAEEMRWLEYAQRLTRQRRGALADRRGMLAPRLFRSATTHGANALGLRAGVIEAGAPADFMTLDLASPSLAGWTNETLLESFIFGAGREAVGEVCVGGRWIEP